MSTTTNQIGEKGSPEEAPGKQADGPDAPSVADPKSPTDNNNNNNNNATEGKITAVIAQNGNDFGEPTKSTAKASEPERAESNAAALKPDMDQEESGDEHLEKVDEFVDDAVFWANKSAPKGRRETKKRADVRLKQNLKHDVLTEIRMSRLEERMDALEKRDPSPETPKSVPKRLPAIPKVNLVSWVDFKNLRDRKEPHHAVDILRGEPLLFHQRQKQIVDMETMKNGLDPASASGPLQLSSIPERIRINSLPLLRIVQKIIGAYAYDRSERPVVMIRPFKPLFYHLREFREHATYLRRKFVESAQEDMGDGDQNPLSLSEKIRHGPDRDYFC
ncbi:hypothetical protein BU26DRAFT_587758 [Trematosphaeria pertusa]|uniref:Uncharacterized protein n=1 Tax=Trematosphaeria pertusa TaxID=390896 RepID=A0A6A6IT41_9PLEO|nr:uncharacterized protein BU26DRAFT_587758 [Trematosphaeria pertusa]KAF2253002.1 hypothetical protein BU26DRAFT_587758 [Trematosphaeria pertusa]